MNVLIATPAALFPATGPAYVAAMLKRAGYSVTGHRYTGKQRFKVVLDSGDYDVLMVGGLCSQFYAMRSMVAEAKKRGIFTVIGGGAVTAEPEIIMDAIGANVGVLGQGEQTSVELVRALQRSQPLAGVAGLIFRHQLNGPGYFKTAPRQDITDLDSLPWPDYEAFGLSEMLDNMRPSDRCMLSVSPQPREYPLAASRSCPFHCTFCFHTSGGAYRRRSIDSIMAELKWAVPRYRINLVFIVDELFSADADRTAQFCSEMKKLIDSTPWRLRWSCSLRVSGVTEALLIQLRDAGCFSAGFGLESYSDAVLKSMSKRITSAEIKSAIDAALSVGMLPGGNFIFGDRAETMETAEDTIRFWRQYKHAGIHLGSLIVCPSSPDYLHCCERGLIRDKLRHMRDRLFEPVNMTRMGDFDFWRLQVRLMKLNSLEVVWVVPYYYDGQELRLRCPHCGFHCRYQNFRLGPFQKGDVMCYHCNRRFFVSSRARRFCQRMLARLAPDSIWTYLAVRTVKRMQARIRALFK